MNRELFFVVYDGAAWRSAPFRTGTGQTLREATSVNVAAYNVRQDEGGPQLDTDPEAYELFSWHLQQLPLAARVAQVPRPGVVLAVHRDAPARTGDAGQAPVNVAILLRRELEGGEEVAERFSRYLDTPASQRSAVPLAERDLLLSHHVEDASVVADLVEQLEAARLTCLALERPAVALSPEGDAWRVALSSSAVLVSVIGRSSVEAGTLLREAGAAWGLGRVVVPALVAVPPDRLHQLMASYQVRTIETPADRAALAAELADFMGGPAGGVWD